MPDLLPLLLKRAIAGKSSDLELRLLACLANPDGNRKVFGQPMPDVLGYFGPDFRALLTPAEQKDPPNQNANQEQSGPGLKTT